MNTYIKTTKDGRAIAASGQPAASAKRAHEGGSCWEDYPDALPAESQPLLERRPQ